MKSAVNKFIETARTAKIVGSNLSAKVELWADAELKDVLDRLDDELRFVMITSQVLVNAFDATQGEASDLAGLNVQVSAADGEKCVRCWHVLPRCEYTCYTSRSMWSLYYQPSYRPRRREKGMPNPQQKKGLFQFYPHNLVWVGLAILAIVLDQWTKWIASTHLNYADPVPVLPFLNWTLLHNYGAAFSFLSDAGGWQRYFFTSLAGIVSVNLLFWLMRMPKNRESAAHSRLPLF